MARLIFVHGSWHGAWCWRDLAPVLRGMGHQVELLDLPGHGAEAGDPAALRLADYVAFALEAVRSRNEPAILAGHSTGGITITGVAERAPRHVAALVYLTAALPPVGQSMMDLAGWLDPRYLEQIEWSPEGRTAMLRPDAVRDFVYSGCSAEVTDFALAHICTEPALPFSEKITTTPDRFGRVPKHYIECLDDRVFPLALQRHMQSGYSFERVHTLKCGHMAMHSAVDELASILHTTSRHSAGRPS